MKKAIISILFIAVASSAMAQTTETAYYTDGYLYGHEMNPAKGADQSYVSFPALGNLNLDVKGTIGLQDVLFNRNGKTVLFTNPDVGTEEFLKNISDKNDFNMDMKMTLMSVGFKGMGGYNTLSVGARAESSIRVPGTLLRMAKEGLSNQTYDFSDMSVHANAFAEIALGHSHQIGDNLRIGAKAKVLVGIANIDADFREARLDLNEDKYTATVDADVQASLKGLKYKTEVSEHTGQRYVNGAEVDGGSPINGFGFAVDLGAEYKVTDDLTVSAAILDLGTINYNNNMLATTGGRKSFDTSKYTFSADDNASNSFEEESDRMMDDLASLYELQDKGDQGSRSVGLSPTVNAGLEYNLVGEKLLTVGGLFTKKFGSYGWYDGRVSLNAAPTKWFSASVSADYGTYGAGLGWALNLHPTGFNVFVAMDNVFTSMAKQGIPLTKKGSFAIGVNFPF